MYTLYKFHFLNGISEINQLFDDILIIWPAPVYTVYTFYCNFNVLKTALILIYIIWLIVIFLLYFYFIKSISI